MAVRPGQPHIEETLSALQFGSRARKIKVNASKNLHKNWKLECVKLEAQLAVANKSVLKMTKQIVKLKRKVRNGGEKCSDDDDDTDEEEEEGGGGGGSGSDDKKKDSSERRRRESVHAAKSHKQALALQMKEMQQTLEAKLAESLSHSASKEDELDMYKNQLREQKKHGSQLQALVTKLQEENYGLELERTELVASKDMLESEVDQLEFSIEEVKTKSFTTRAELEASLATSDASLKTAHADLRDLEMEIRRAGSDNDALRGEIHGIQQKHESVLGAAHMEMHELKARLEKQTSQLRSQLRASDHRHREIVRRLHETERDVEQKSVELEESMCEVDGKEERVQRALKDVELERVHSNRLLALVTQIRSTVLRLHLERGAGVPEKKLLRTSFVLARSEDERRSQLRRQHPWRRGRRVEEEEEEEEEMMASETASLDNHQEILLDSLRLLVENVRVREKDRLNLLWDRERERKTEERSVLRRENERMKSQSKADRERSEYALSLVKAMKPLITQTLGGMVD